jgi:hypothetical protein
MGQNLLKGELGDKTNPILAASAFNFKKFVGKAIEALLTPFKRLVKKTKRPKVKLHGYLFRKSSNQYPFSVSSVPNKLLISFY